MLPTIKKICFRFLITHKIIKNFFLKIKLILIQQIKCLEYIISCIHLFKKFSDKFFRL